MTASDALDHKTSSPGDDTPHAGKRDAGKQDAGKQAGEMLGGELLGDDEALGAIETQVAFLMRLGEASRRSTGLKPHRALDRAAYVILRHLQRDGRLNVSALADRLNLDGSTVTRQVTALQHDGLVERHPDPKDGRGTVIEATPTGIKQVNAVRAARRALYDRVLHDWSPTERENLARTLERLANAIDDFVRKS